VSQPTFLDELRSALDRGKEGQAAPSIPRHAPLTESWAGILDFAPRAAARTERPAPRRVPFGAPGLSRAEMSPALQSLLVAFEAQGARIAERFTEAELRAEWRRLARAVHPDRNPGTDGTRLIRLQSAYLALVRALRAGRKEAA
jgi:hypothetical protein